MYKDLRSNKKTIREFLRANYSDEKLCQLLDHARSGKLSFNSCCCFIGIATADHELRDCNSFVGGLAHYEAAKSLPGGVETEWAVNYLAILNGAYLTEEFRDPLRRARIIPMVKSEIRRRLKIQFAGKEEYGPNRSVRSGENQKADYRVTG